MLTQRKNTQKKNMLEVSSPATGIDTEKQLDGASDVASSPSESQAASALYPKLSLEEKEEGNPEALSTRKRLKKLSVFKDTPIQSNVCFGAYQVNYDWYLEFEHLQGVKHPTACSIVEQIQYQRSRLRLCAKGSFKKGGLEKAQPAKRQRRSKDKLISEVLELNMVECPAGSFRMGSLIDPPLLSRLKKRISTNKSSWGLMLSRDEKLLMMYSNQSSCVEITKSFLLGEIPVTRKLFRTVMGYYATYNSTWDDARQADLEARKQLAINNVTWFEAIVFCNRLSKLMGLSPYYSISDIHLVVRVSSTSENELVKSFQSFDEVFEYGMGLYTNRHDPNVNLEELKGLFVSPVMNFSIVQRLISRIRQAKIERIVESKGYRLPTDAEWEYAARSGNSEQMYPGSDNSSKVACFYRPKKSAQGVATRRSLEPLKTLLPNSWGLYDMCGNVQEWCADTLNLPSDKGHSDYVGIPKPVSLPTMQTDPCSWVGFFEQPIWDIDRENTKVQAHIGRVLRGGSSANADEVSVFDKTVKVGYQYCEMQPYSVYKGDFFGFRIARNL